MTNTVTISSAEELSRYKTTILSNLRKSVQDIKAMIDSEDAQEIFKHFKFDKIATEPLSGKPENLVEVINQSQTYFVTLAATEYLLSHYPEKSFLLNWGNVSGYDIESTDGEIIAECFAATSYRSNGKLTADLKRLFGDRTAARKYEFFYACDFSDTSKKYYENKYVGVCIVKLDSI